MTNKEHSQDTQPDEPSEGSPLVRILEKLDNLFHVVVAVLFILMAATVLIHTCVVFAKQAPLVLSVPTDTGVSSKDGTHAEKPAPAHESQASVEKTVVTKEAGADNVDPFLHNSLEILSSILFAVIILELLRTILTYLQTHNIQAIMQEFIVVGIISSVRKILLVGAESSLSSSTGIEFIHEAIGTLLSIAGILALITGLVILQKAFGARKEVV